MRGTLVKIADPRNGVSREEFEAVCRALGINPILPKVLDADGEERGSVVSSEGSRTKERP